MSVDAGWRATPLLGPYLSEVAGSARGYTVNRTWLLGHEPS